MTPERSHRKEMTLGRRFATAVGLIMFALPSTIANAEDLRIASISKETLWRNRDGKGRTWFHPRACMMPGSNGKPVALMTLQEIGGSDYFGQVHWSMSADLGKTWSDPEPIAALGRDSVPGRDDGLEAAVCDVTPQYHPQTGAVIALGHVVFYKGDYFARKEQLPRYPIYVYSREMTKLGQNARSLNGTIPAAVTSIPITAASASSWPTATCRCRSPSDPRRNIAWWPGSMPRSTVSY